MIDLYLKADNEAAMLTELKAAGFITDEESGALYRDGCVLDIIGTIYQQTGETTLVDGERVPVMAAVPGYHVNVRTTSQNVADALSDLRIYPVTPVRVWA